MILREGNPALAKAITIHPKMRKSPLESIILKPASNNSKLGKGENVITKGHWRGMPMYGISLEERATCPSTCEQWASCFANNMYGAHRIDHTHPEFLEQLERELLAKALTYRWGFVIRVHVIGDYYSKEYAEFWVKLHDSIPQLHIFGFTHHLRDGDIGQVIEAANGSPRHWVRFSDQGGDMSANVDGEGVQCPQQTGKTQSCLTCGVCWGTTKPVSFIKH
jgi:hypothetical protein